MPPLANWKYNYKVEEGSEEDKTQKLLKKEIEWVV
jgi:coproporphyrinogen III oxidase